MNLEILQRRLNLVGFFVALCVTHGAYEVLSIAVHAGLSSQRLGFLVPKNASQKDFKW